MPCSPLVPHTLTTICTRHEHAQSNYTEQGDGPREASPGEAQQRLHSTLQIRKASEADRVDAVSGNMPQGMHMSMEKPMTYHIHHEHEHVVKDLPRLTGMSADKVMTYRLIHAHTIHVLIHEHAVHGML